MFDKNSGHWIILFITAIALGEVLMFPVLGQVTKPVNTVTRPRSQTPIAQSVHSQAIIRLANTQLPHPLIQGQGNLPLQALSGGLSWTMTVKTGEHSGQFLLDTGASISIVTAAWTKLGVADLQYESLKMQLLKHWLRLVSRCMQNSISYPD